MAITGSASNSSRRGASGGQHALWIYLGGGGLLLLVDRESGEVVWTLPQDASGGIRVGHVLDDERLLLPGADRQDMALQVLEIPTQ